MSTFSEQFIQQQNEALLQRRKELLEDLRSFAHKNPAIEDDWETNFPEIGEDEDENAQEVTMYLNDLPIEYALETDLRDVNEALRRIQSDTYGICTNCDRPINKERLGAVPEATTCMECSKE